MNKECERGGIDKAFKTLDPEGSRETGHELLGVQEVQSILPEERDVPGSVKESRTDDGERAEGRGGALDAAVGAGWGAWGARRARGAARVDRLGRDPASEPPQAPVQFWLQRVWAPRVGVEEEPERARPRRSLAGLGPGQVSPSATASVSPPVRRDPAVVSTV